VRSIEGRTRIDPIEVDVDAQFPRVEGRQLEPGAVIVATLDSAEATGLLPQSRKICTKAAVVHSIRLIALGDVIKGVTERGE
jgi:hypothetical protein